MAVTKVQVLNEDGVTYTSADIGALATNVILSDEETNVETALGNKVDKVQGKNLSTNDYTTAEKEKLTAIEAQAQKNVQSDWSQSDNSADDFIKNKPNILNTNEAFGQGYGTCSTAEDSTAKVGVLANYELVKGGVVVIRFVNKVRANSTLNINSKGAKSIYFRNNPIAANVIEAGDNVTLMYDGTYYRVISIDRGGSSGAGHTIIDNDDIVMAQRDLLQFADAKVEDDSTNNKTIVRQTQVVATKAEWDAMTHDPNVTYYLPWMSNTEYAEDRTPIGTVISVTTAKTGEVTGITTPTGEFPSSDYLVCDGAVKNIADYPKLADWFSERYGSKNYFGGNGTTTFAVPDFSADFPTNGILSIKAQMTSTQITYAEVNDSLTTENNVWSAERVNNINRRTRKNITADITADQGAKLIAAVAEQDLAKYGYAIGDYFIGTSGYQYNLGDMDCNYGGYNNQAVVNTHHIGIVVDTKENTPWLSTGTVTNYSSSTLHAYLTNTALPKIKSDFKTLFGGSTGAEHLLPRTELDNAIGGWGTTWTGLANCLICALTEVQVYGSRVFGVDGYQTGTGNKHLEIFRKFRYNEVVGNMWFWLKSLVSASVACGAHDGGRSNANGVSDSGRAFGLILFH